MKLNTIRSLPLFFACAFILSCAKDTPLVSPPSSSPGITDTSSMSQPISSETANSSSSAANIDLSSTVSSSTTDDPQSSSIIDVSSSEGDNTSSETGQSDSSTPSSDAIIDTSSPVSSSTSSSSSKAAFDPVAALAACETIKKKSCLQEISPYYTRNTIEENYNENFHYFENSLDYHARKCSICSDTLKLTKAVLQYAMDNSNNTDETLLKVEVTELPLELEGLTNVGQISFKFWDALSGRVDSNSRNQIMKKALAGEAARVRLVRVTFSNDDGTYTMPFTTLNTDTTDGLFYWRPEQATCVIDVCFD